MTYPRFPLISPLGSRFHILQPTVFFMSSLLWYCSYMTVSWWRRKKGKARSICRCGPVFMNGKVQLYIVISSQGQCLFISTPSINYFILATLAIKPVKLSFNVVISLILLLGLNKEKPL